jgi:hypothetical protein
MPIKADGRPMEGHFAGYPAARPWMADFVDIRQEKRAKRAKTRPDIHTDRRRRPICWISGWKVAEGRFAGYPAGRYWKDDLPDIRP